MSEWHVAPTCIVIQIVRHRGPHRYGSASAVLCRMLISYLLIGPQKFNADMTLGVPYTSTYSYVFYTAIHKGGSADAA